MNTLVINSLTHVHLVLHDEIIYCKSDSCYSSVFLNNGEELIICKSLTKLSKELAPEIFVRVSQSYMINKNYISQVDKKAKHILLRDKTLIPFNISIKYLLKILAAR